MTKPTRWYMDKAMMTMTKVKGKFGFPRTFGSIVRVLPGSADLVWMTDQGDFFLLMVCSVTIMTLSTNGMYIRARITSED